MVIRSLRASRATLLGLAVWGAALLGVGQSTRADFLFSPTGTGAGDAQLVSTIDPSPGNALAKGGVTAIQNFAAGGPAAGNTFQLYYQANVGAFDNSQGNPITSGTFAGLNTTYQITVVSSVTEVVTGITGNTATFAVSAIQSASSFVKLFESPGITSNNLTGAGFNVGTLVYQGSPISNANGFGVFANNSPGATQLFDQHGPDNYGGKLSVVGNGASTIDFQTTFTNPNYVVSAPQALAAQFTTTNTVPFLGVDPSMLFPGLGPAGVDITPNLGGVNGQTGPDFQFVADAFVTAVPEPSSIALTAVGLCGLLAVLRRRRVPVG